MLYNILEILPLIIYGIIIFILFCLMLGVGEKLLRRTNLIKEFREKQKQWEIISLKLYKRSLSDISITDFGHKRLSELTGMTDKDLKNRKIQNIAIIVWYKEKKLNHLFKELKLVSSIFLILFVIGMLIVIYNHKKELHSIFDLSNHLAEANYHVIPILEAIALVTIYFRWRAEKIAIEELLDEE